MSFYIICIKLLRSITDYIAKKPIPPKIYAMFTLLFLLILVLMVVMNLLQLRSDKKKQQGC